MIKRCNWCNLDNPKYVKYHDEEWGIENYDEQYLFEMLLLESFQAGLSWECVLNKREDFRIAFDYFDVDKVAQYEEEKIEKLLRNDKIIRNRLKIKAAISNAKIFKEIEREFGSFAQYLFSFTHHQVFYEIDQTRSELSDVISSDLKRRGMKFVGTTIIYAYLQAIGVILSHSVDCYKYKRKEE